MKLYKTSVAFRCEKGHVNLLDDRVPANSPDKANELSIENMKKTECKWCGSLPVGKYKILGTEELP